MKIVELITDAAAAFSKLFNVWGWSSTTSVKKKILLAKIDGTLKVPVGIAPIIDTVQGRTIKPRWNPDEHDVITAKDLGGVENIFSIEFDEEAFYKYSPYIDRPTANKK